VEAIEMVAIVAGVGATRGWRAATAGAAAGFAVLAVVVAVFGLALTAIPIAPLRVVVGALLLVFGLNWLRKGIRRVAANGLRGTTIGAPAAGEEDDVPADGPDWTGFVLSFKGVLLEGLEVAFIVVTFGSTSSQLGVAAAAGIAAVVAIGALGLAIQPAVRRIPRSVLQLVVGLLLTTFGTFWAAEGLGVDWPGSDAAILGLLVLYAGTAAVYVAVERGALRVPRPAAG
jgi:Ca2+/H+ antiporter, TMEM165/GDT1 family